MQLVAAKEEKAAAKAAKLRAGTDAKVEKVEVLLVQMVEKILH